MNAKPILKELVTIILILNLVSFAFHLNAQTKGELNRNHPGQIRFSVTTSLYDQLKIQNNGESLFNSSLGLGGEVMVIYSQPIISGIRINGGFGLSLIPYNYSYHFLVPPGSIFEPLSNTPIYFSTQGMYPYEVKSVITFPISLQKTIALNRRNSWQLNFEVGIKLNAKQSFPYSINNRSSVQFSDQTKAEYFRFDFDSAGKRNYVSYTLKTGVLKYNSKNNSFHCNLVLQYSPVIFGTGIYQFSHLGFESYGTVEQHVNYIGLELAYGLTFNKKQ